MGAFWDAVAGKLAARWAGIAATAVVFWAGAMLAFAGSRWSRLLKVIGWLNAQTVVAQLAAVLGVLVLVAASALVVERGTTPVLRLLEGYWPPWLDGVADRRRRHVAERRAADTRTWQQLQAQMEQQQPTARQRADLAGLEHRRRHQPVLDSELLPTRVGNILRAAETRPSHRYGLEAVVIWPRLWLVLPEPTRHELTGAREALDASVAATIWGVGFVAFTPWAWWAAPVGITVAVAAALWWLPGRAAAFADLVESAYDLYRSALYQQLRWPLPASPAGEHDAGSALTRYLLRGSDQPDPEFTPP